MFNIKKLTNRLGRVTASLVLMTAQMTPFFAFAPQASAAPEPNPNDVSYWCDAGGVKIDTGAVGSHEIAPVTVTISANTDTDKTEVTNVVGDSVEITKVVVKGGNDGGDGNGNAVYTPEFIYPLVTPGNETDVSHVIVCYDEIPNTVTVEVVKMLSPSDDSGRFDLKIEGTTHKEEAGHGDTTGQVEVDLDNNDNITVRETAHAGTDLSDYTTTIVCSDADGEIGSNAPAGASSRSLNLATSDLSPGDNIQCIFTNTLIPITAEFTLVKYVKNNSGGNAMPNDFKLTVDGKPVLSGAKNTYDVDTPLPIDETLLTGYSFVSITGDDKCPSVLGGTVTLAPGDDITCTINNDDQPGNVTLYKKVIIKHNGNLGPLDFVLTVSGEQGFEQYATSGVSIMLDAGTYTFGELENMGYKNLGWLKGDCSTNGLLTIVNGGNYKCVIVNVDKPGRIIVHKKVINDNGGEKRARDFRFHVNDGEWERFENDGTNIVLVDRGRHSIVEDEHRDYDAKYRGLY